MLQLGAQARQFAALAFFYAFDSQASADGINPSSIGAKTIGTPTENVQINCRHGF